jgi:hypothetical protein
VFTPGSLAGIADATTSVMSGFGAISDIVDRGQKQYVK